MWKTARRGRIQDKCWLQNAPSRCQAMHGLAMVHIAHGRLQKGPCWMIVLVDMPASPGDEEVGELFPCHLGAAMDFRGSNCCRRGLGVERRSRSRR